MAQPRVRLARLGVCLALLLSCPVAGTAEEPRGEAVRLLALAEECAQRGDLQGAISHAQKALASAPMDEDVALHAKALGALGDYYGTTGDLARALSYREKAVVAFGRAGDRAAQSQTLQRLGYIYDRVGETGKALSAEKRAYSLILRMNDPLEKAISLAQQGVYLINLSRVETALDLLLRALKIAEEYPENLRAVRVLATSGECLGVLEFRRGRVAAAISSIRQAVSNWRKVGSHGQLASSLNTLGRILGEEERYDEAADCHAKALVAARRARSAEKVAESHWLLGAALLELGQAERALGHLRTAHHEVEAFFAGLSDERALYARQNWFLLYETGAMAAIAAESVEDLCFFLEGLRARSLHQAMRHRDRVLEGAVPEGLLLAASTARDAEQEAVMTLLAAMKREDESAIPLLQKRVEKARREMLAAIGAIQRNSRLAGNLAYPALASLADIQGSLLETEALVLYAVGTEEAAALVITPGRAWPAMLGAKGPILDAYNALDEVAEDPAAIERTRKRLSSLLIEPLKLPPEVKRLVVSPHSILFELPFSWLAPSLEVSHVPSGSTFCLLSRERKAVGQEVLALGDPDYGKVPPALQTEVAKRGSVFRPLPASEKEARAVGDIVLVEGKASETGFLNAVVKRKRWRAVHLACHGYSDEEDPFFSALILTPDKENDGVVSVLDILGLRIAADLVVLSACKTGLGDAWLVEGMIGFPRAFLAGGASRVLVSLIEVDDEATRELMLKFYEHWNPKKGGNSLGAAAALDAAQAHVRSQEKWAHPRYWAGWVLWGLPD